jgi:hypothetical protein
MWYINSQKLSLQISNVLMSGFAIHPFAFEALLPHKKRKKHIVKIAY